MTFTALMVMVASLHTPSFAGTLSFGPQHELSLRRTSDGYAGTLGELPVDGQVKPDGVLHLMAGKKPVAHLRRTEKGFELLVAGNPTPELATVLLAPNVLTRGPKFAGVMVPILPGASLGEVRLGQTLADLAKLGPTKPHPSGQFGDAVHVLGPYTITLSGGRVSAIEITPSESDVGLVLPWMPVMPGSTMEQVAKVGKSCSAVEHTEGGNVVTCEGLVLKEGPRCVGREASGVCTRWDVTTPVLSLQIVRATREP